MAEKPSRILLVEDDPAHARVVCRAFQSLTDSFSVAVVASLAEAGEALENQTPDLVIADWKLPDGKGTDLLPKNGEDPLYPVIIMTSQGREEIAVAAMKAGALDYVVKSEVNLAGMQHIARRALREWNLIIERKQATDQLKASLRDKEVLLREIHHRVKNNLAIMNSLLGLQSEYATDDRQLQMFKDAQNRIRSMALAHDKLYQSDRLTGIKMEDYVSSLVDHLAISAGIGGAGIVIEKEIDEIALGIDTAIPLGFILTELVTNALKHAFADGIRGEVQITLKSLAEEEFLLVVRDDGKGMPTNIDLRNPQSLGLELVSTFVEQLKGRAEIDTSDGTEVRIRFKELKKHKRSHMS